MTPTLNWREIARLVEDLRPRILGQFVDRIIVPERARFPSGYLKGEWAMRLHSREADGVLIFSIRARHPYITYSIGKGPKAATAGTRSPFDLAASKLLKGARLRSFEAVPRERSVIFGFEAEGEKIGLVLTLIPALPEALLVKLGGPPGQPWPILARSRTLREASAPTHYSPPDGSKSPSDLGVREELFQGKHGFLSQIESGLDREAFEVRLKSSQRELKDLIKHARDRARQLEVAQREAQAEPNWQRYGDLLKASLIDPPPIQKEKGPKGDLFTRRLYDFEKEEYFAVPCDPKLQASAQALKFYNMARRKGRRLYESELRGTTFRETAEKLEKLLAHPPELPSILTPSSTPIPWPELERFERAAGRPLQAPTPPSAGRSKGGGKRVGAWLGKSFTSKDGLTILVGRSRDENLELTFKHARGNDIWMHVRGKPGAHLVIPVNSGKSVPLETLLDAAQLTIHYSSNGKWGKTEVDYAFKKYVKRIKDSTEASYSNNKTLLIEPDAARLKRLLSQDA